MDGIIVGADLSQEWLLPWWWEHYRKTNSSPVAFIDLGMSFEKKEWCKERGQHIPLRVVDFAAEKEGIDPVRAKKMEEVFGTQFWDCRNAWFKKPLACLKSPFARTLWIDLDCEVRDSLAPLFDYAGKCPCLALAKDHYQHLLGYPSYNSGVIAFCQNHPLLHEWAVQCKTQNQLFRGDQEVLSHMIAERGSPIDELPPLYNWSRCEKERSDAVILHWHGAYGKAVIRNQLSRQSCD